MGLKDLILTLPPVMHGKSLSSLMLGIDLSDTPDASKSGKPCSIPVDTSGSAGRRFGANTASARNSPERMCGMTAAG